MDKNVIAVGLFLIIVFAMTATAHYAFVAHDAAPPAEHGAQGQNHEGAGH